MKVRSVQIKKYPKYLMDSFPGFGGKKYLFPKAGNLTKVFLIVNEWIAKNHFFLLQH